MPDPTSANLACQTALTALEQDPLALAAPVAAHLQVCPACAEARVLWLALAEAPEVAAPAGYYEGLPFRILRKLPPGRTELRRPALYWLAAAGMLAALGLGTTGFLLGRAVRTPMVEASQPRTPATLQAPLTETPFFEGDDPLTQLTDLTPQQAESALQRLQALKPPAAEK